MASIRSGSREVRFDEDEWLCVRFCYVKAGTTGTASRLITGGELDAPAVAQTRAMIETMRSRLDSPLDYAMQHGTGAAAKLFFEHFEKRKLRYVRAYDSGKVVFEGTKRVDAEPHRLRDVPAFVRAFEKLESASIPARRARASRPNEVR